MQPQLRSFRIKRLSGNANHLAGAEVVRRGRRRRRQRQDAALILAPQELICQSRVIWETTLFENQFCV